MRTTSLKLHHTKHLTDYLTWITWLETHHLNFFTYSILLNWFTKTRTCLNYITWVSSLLIHSLNYLTLINFLNYFRATSLKLLWLNNYTWTTIIVTTPTSTQLESWVWHENAFIPPPTHQINSISSISQLFMTQP